MAHGNGRPRASAKGAVAVDLKVVKRGLVGRDSRIRMQYVKICECDAPQMPVDITKGICGNCQGARGPDCKGLNKPIKEVQQQAITSS